MTTALLGFCVLLFMAGAALDAWATPPDTPGFPDSAFSRMMSAFWKGARHNLGLGCVSHVHMTAYGEWWRMVTACFLHWGIIHLAFNGMALRDLGRMCEFLWGRRRLFCMAVATGVMGNVVSFGVDYAWSWMSGGGGVLPEKLSAGASGALCGLLGWLLAAWVRKRGIPDTLGRMLRQWAIFILVFGLLPGMNVDNAAHVGGGLTGFALGWFQTPRIVVRPSPATERAWTAATVGCALLLAGSYGAMLARWLA